MKQEGAALGIIGRAIPFKVSPETGRAKRAPARDELLRDLDELADTLAET